jgi:hypothetical protein
MTCAARDYFISCSAVELRSVVPGETPFQFDGQPFQRCAPLYVVEPDAIPPGVIKSYKVALTGKSEGQLLAQPAAHFSPDPRGRKFL